MTRGRVVAACLVAALAAPCLLLFRDAAVIADNPFLEDAYYSLGVARHLALGDGPSVDGAHLTNGFQPLWSFLVAPVYWLAGGDRLGALRGVFVAEWACLVAAALGVMRLAASFAGGRGAPSARTASLVAGLAWCASAHLWRQSLNGLETGLYLAATAWFWNLWLATPRDVRGALRLGCAAGALVLVRVDAVFVVGVVAASELSAGDDAFGARMRRAATIGVAAALVSSPWWIYNATQFGELMPSSGRATEGFGVADAVNRTAMADAVSRGLVPNAWFFGQPSTVGRVLRYAAALAVVVLALRRAKGPATGARAPSIAGLVRAQLAVAALFVGWYATRSGSYYFYARYLAPTAVLSVPLVASVVAPWLAAPGRLRAAAFVAVALAAPALAATYAVTTGRPDLRPPSPYLAGQLALVRRHVPPDETVAAYQSGTLGYFREGPVLNLDGKTNAEALRRAADVGAYLREKRVRWLCDNEVVCRWATTSPGAGRWARVDAADIFELWRREED